MSEERANGNSSPLPCSTLSDAAKLIRDVVGRDVKLKRRFGMYQDQINDLCRIVDVLESNAQISGGTPSD